MERPISKFNIEPDLLVGKWQGIYYKVNHYTGNLETIETKVEFYQDFTGDGNIIQNFYGNTADNNFKWFPLGDSLQIITKIQDNYSNIPLLLFKIDNEEMVFHLGGSCILKRKSNG